MLLGPKMARPGQTLSWVEVGDGGWRWVGGLCDWDVWLWVAQGGIGWDVWLVGG